MKSIGYPSVSVPHEDKNVRPAESMLIKTELVLIEPVVALDILLGKIYL